MYPRRARMGDVLPLVSLRKKAAKRMAPPPAVELRLALLGGYTLHPFRDVLEHLLAGEGFEARVFSGEYDNYVQEILAPQKLQEFRPEVILIVPSERNHRFRGTLADPVEAQLRQAQETASNLLQLCKNAHDATGAEILLANFLPAPHFDPGPIRARLPGSDWTFRRLVNLELGLKAPSFVHVLDLDFLSSRVGALASHDPRGWYETKQFAAPDFQLTSAREASLMIASFRRPMKKVLVTDLDNTLWGGVIGDDGLAGIELGTVTPRGEAFREFQDYLKSLSHRGVLLAVCSKNSDHIAREAFEKHPRNGPGSR